MKLALRVALVSSIFGIFLILSGCSDNSGGGGSSYTPYTYTPYNYTPYNYTPYNYTPYNYTPYSSLCASAVKPDGTPYQSTDEIRKAIEGIAHPFPTDVAFYRWGNSDYELERIRLSNSGDDIFEMSTVNAGAGGAVAGSGLYLADNPTASSSYGREVKPAQKASIITVVLPKGSLFLDGLNSADVDALRRLGLTNTDVENCNPNVIFKYQANWWILKTPVFSGKKVRAEKFSGRYLESKVLAQSQARLNGETNNNGGYVSLGALNEKEVLDEIGVRPVYNSNEAEPIPVPLKSLYTVLEWPSVAELRNLTPPNDPTQRTYRWTWNGSCNLYEKDADGALVLVSRNQHDQNCRLTQPVTKTRLDDHFSKAFSPGCYEVVVQRPEVIVGKVHSTSYYCY